jgi:hypothetical protein
MADITQMQRVLAQVAEEQARLARLFEPSRALAETVRGLDLPHLRIVNEAVAAMRRQNEFFSTAVRPPRIFEDIARQVSASRSIMEQITAPFARVHADLRLQMSVFEKVSADARAMERFHLSIPQLSQTAFAWNCAALGLANQMQQSGLFAQREALATRLLTIPGVYTEFVQKTTDRLASTTTPAAAAILRGSLNLAEEQLLDISDALSEVLVVPDDTDEPSDVRPLGAPYQQQDDLLNLDAIEDEQETRFLISASSTAAIVELSNRVLRLVIQCNEASKTSPAGVEIFKPTTRLLEVFNDLPWLAVKDRFRFADLVDCLYFIFYEGAGKDNLRFMAKQGGPLTDEDCDLIWCIKHLRNKWTRHDADHGKEKDIQKSWRDLAAKLRWLGLAEHPTNAQHFQTLHQRLLELAADFLTLILSKLKLK